MRKYLKTLRKKKSLSQQDVATKIGITRQYYNLIESGERQKDMTTSMAGKLADVLGVPLSYILDNEKR